MIRRGVAGPLPHDSPRSRARLVLLVCAALLAAVLTLYVGTRAVGEDPSRCQRHTAAAEARSAQVTGTGPAVLVVGDSYSVGLGLEQPTDAWPGQLAGQVRVAGFSGSGFSAGASGCGEVSFADRAATALAGVAQAAALVVVEGGLNDHDQPAVEIRAGFERLLAAVGDRPVVVVGPVTAPARAEAVPRVDALLADLAAAHRVPYVQTSGLELDYLGDRLHLTPEGHRALGVFVAEHLAALGR